MANTKPETSIVRLIEKKEVAEFKVPSATAVPPRKKKKILDEDEYVRRLEEIIQRDFFPDLTKLQVQAAYLEALETNDVAKLREIYEKYSVGGSGGLSSELGSASPATFETPLREPDAESHKNTKKSTSTINSTNQKKVDERKQSLDEFLFKNTSEDNESFEEIMDEAKKKHRLKYAWLYEEENKSKSKQEGSLALPSIEKQAIEDAKPAQVDTWGYQAKNSIMYYPEGAPLTEDEKQRNALDKEHIVHKNTHFQSNPFDESRNLEAVRQAARMQSNARIQGHVDVDGKEIRARSTPAVNGFSFVKTPSPAPGVGETPLMTWGEIEGTPFRLDGSDTPLPSSCAGPAFHLQDVPERDRIALKLAEKVSQSYRDRRGRTTGLKSSHVSTPSPLNTPSSKSVGTLSQRIASMSPAARRLATSRLGIRLGTDSALQASYTPRRSTNGSQTPTPRQESSDRLQRTPRTPSHKSSSVRDNLTDNLLQLPKRSRAQDFF